MLPPQPAWSVSRGGPFGVGILLTLAWSWWSGTGPWTRQLGRHTTPGTAIQWRPCSTETTSTSIAPARVSQRADKGNPTRLVEVERRVCRRGQIGLLLIEETTDLLPKSSDGNRRDVVARYDTPLLKAVRRSEENLRRQRADRRRDRCDGHRVHVGAHELPRQDEH